MHYLSVKTYAPLRRILESTLLTPHLISLISMPNSGLDSMIDTGKIDDLARMYKLFSMVDIGLPTLRRALKDSIVQRGKEINDLTRGTDGEDELGGDDIDLVDAKGKGKTGNRSLGYSAVALALKWVEDVLALKDKFDHVLKLSFNEDMTIHVSMVEVNSNICTIFF